MFDALIIIKISKVMCRENLISSKYFDFKVDSQYSSVYRNLIPRLRLSLLAAFYKDINLNDGQLKTFIIVSMFVFIAAVLFFINTQHKYLWHHLHILLTLDIYHCNDFLTGLMITTTLNYSSIEICT